MTTNLKKIEPEIRQEKLSCLNMLMKDRLNTEIYKKLARIYKKNGEYDKAVKTLKKAREITPFDDEIYSETGTCELITGKAGEAARHFREAIRLNPKNIKTQFRLAVTHEIMEEPETALLIYEKISQTHRNCVNAYIKQAQILMNAEEFVAAEKVFKEILRLKPEYTKAVLGLGICNDKTGFTKRAKRYYRKYMCENPEALDFDEVLQRFRKLKERE
ncbi:MAG: tetratricopeptide repeat protein [Candidatus Gastranaerophilaceae bacterium]